MPAYKLLVVFTLRRQWSDKPTDLVKSKAYTEKPTYETLISVGIELFWISYFSDFTVRAISGRSEYGVTLTDWVIGRDAEIHFVPRYYTCTFHIVSWVIEYSCSEVQKFVKINSSQGQSRGIVSIAY